jgi:hypothetical protein
MTEVSTGSSTQLRDSIVIYLTSNRYDVAMYEAFVNAICLDEWMKAPTDWMSIHKAARVRYCQLEWNQMKAKKKTASQLQKIIDSAEQRFAQCNKQKRRVISNFFGPPVPRPEFERGRIPPDPATGDTGAQTLEQLNDDNAAKLLGWCHEGNAVSHTRFLQHTGTATVKKLFAATWPHLQHQLMDELKAQVQTGMKRALNKALPAWKMATALAVKVKRSLGDVLNTCIMLLDAIPSIMNPMDIGALHRTVAQTEAFLESMQAIAPLVMELQKTQRDAVKYLRKKLRETKSKRKGPKALPSDGVVQVGDGVSQDPSDLLDALQLAALFQPTKSFFPLLCRELSELVLLVSARPVIGLSDALSRIDVDTKLWNQADWTRARKQIVEYTPAVIVSGSDDVPILLSVTGLTTERYEHALSVMAAAAR